MLTRRFLLIRLGNDFFKNHIQVRTYSRVHVRVGVHVGVPIRTHTKMFYCIGTDIKLDLFSSTLLSSFHLVSFTLHSNEKGV